MKKKVLHVLMAVALFASAASMFVSCKDTAGDEYAENRVEIKYLNDLLNQQVVALKADLAALQQAQQQCKSNCQNRMDELQNQINQLAAAEAEHYSLLQQLWNKEAQDAADIAALKKRIEYVEKDIATMKSQISTLRIQVSTLQTQVKTLEEQIYNIYDVLNNYETRISNNETNITNLTNLYNQLSQKLAQVEATANAADQLSKANKASIDSICPIITTINNSVTNIWSQVNTLRDSVINAQAQADAAYTLAQTDSANIDSIINKVLPNYYTKDDVYTKHEVDSMFAEASEKIADAKQVADHADSLANAANTLAGSAMDKANEALDSIAAVKQLANDAMNAANTAQTTANNALDSAAANKVLIQDLETAMKDADKLLQDSIDVLAQDLADLKIEVKNIQDELNILKSDLAKMITSIVVQSVANPVTGTLTTPFGFNTNILCAFYGENVNGTVDFPVDAIGADDYSLIGSSESFIINSGETLVDDMDNGVANAGKIYTTINPNTVNFAGEKVTLETSAGNAAEIELSPLKKSDKEIMFGYTRADNGFYEADATLPYDKIQDAKITKNLNMGELKEIAKSALNELKTKGDANFNVSNAYVKIMDAVSEVIPAYALKATWTDSAQVKHSIFSKYEIAATALKPLSYEFLAGSWDAPKIPSITYEKLGIKFKLEEPKGVYFNSDTPIYLVYDASSNLVSVHGGWVYGNSLADNEKAKQDAINEAAAIGGTWVERNLRNLMSIYDALLLDKVITDAYCFNINYLEEQMKKQIEDNVKRILDKVNKVIGKINTRIQNANYYLQPNVLVKGGDDWYRASQYKTMPSMAVGTGWVMLIPTSNTAELVCPAYKKFVAVTDVVKDDFSVSAKGGDATCKSILAAANDTSYGMATIYTGKDPIAFNATQAGYIYEVTYASLDYSGYTRTEKVYIRVK